MIRTSSEHRITWVSPGITELTGWPVDEVVGRFTWDFVHPDDLDSLRSTMSDLQEGLVDSAGAHVRLVRKDGSYKYWALDARRPIANQRDIIATLRDVDTEFRARQEADAEQARRLALLDSMLDPHVLLEAVRDSSGHVVDFRCRDANVIALQLLPVPAQGLIGATLREVLGTDFAVPLIDWTGRVVSTGEPFAMDGAALRPPPHREERLFDIRIAPVRGFADLASFNWRDVTALRRQADEYKLLANEGADLVALIDADDAVVWVSPSVERVLGRAPEDVVGHPYRDLIAAPDLDQYDEDVHRFLGSGEVPDPVTVTRLMRGKDGTDHWMEIATHFLSDERRLGWRISRARDIDAEVRMREVVTREAALRKAILDSMLDPHVLLQAVRDDSGEIVDFVYADANEAACEYNRLPYEQLIGASLMQLLPGHAGTGLLDDYRHTVNTGEPLVLDDYVYPHEILAEPRHFDIRGVKVGDALSYTWRDVTDRAEAEARLATSEANYRALIERMAHVTLVSDTRWRVTYISAAVTDLLGYDPDDLVGQRLSDLIHPDDRAGAADYRAHLLATGSGQFRGRLRAKDGTYRWVESSAQTQHAPDGSTTGVVGVWRDASSAEASEVIAKHIGDPVFSLAADGSVTWTSPSVPRQLGGTQAQWLGLTLRDRIHPDDRPTLDETVKRVARGRPASGRVRLRGLDEVYHWVDGNATATDQPDVFVVSIRVVDDEVAREQTLKRIAGSDSLTGLSNRRDLLMRLAAILSKRRQGQLTGLVFCDMDNLKQINDSAGHIAGDTVISTVAQRIKHLVRRDDICARFGGDEFVVVLIGLHSIDQATAIAEKIRQAAATPVAVSGHRNVIPSLSIGVTLAHDGEDATALIARADTAMYQAKDAGRNTVVAVE